MLTVVETWLADACGTSLPTFNNDEPTDYMNSLAWQASLGISRALATGDVAQAAVIAEQSLPVLLSDSGLEDDFVHLWPPLVLAAIANGDVVLAERMLEPVTSAPPALVTPAVNAELHRLQGLLAALSGDEPSHVEAELRAGIEALEAFGAVGFRARAEEEISAGGWSSRGADPTRSRCSRGRARRTRRSGRAGGWPALETGARAPSPACARTDLGSSTYAAAAQLASSSRRGPLFWLGEAGMADHPGAVRRPATSRLRAADGGVHHLRDRRLGLQRRPRGVDLRRRPGPPAGSARPRSAGSCRPCCSARTAVCIADRFERVRLMVLLDLVSFVVMAACARDWRSAHRAPGDRDRGRARPRSAPSYEPAVDRDDPAARRRA